ncbi:triose-phosphate isomerase [Pseudomonas matsuisoli]|uniref:Triosephosphate isomerase n=1 Tax=Pseudomonas matsuisoli TaxID=1515666 RepID=A0A917UUR7_9PSED|nr:triose-phosphate isomerase [Pseudomonas matsuisoli]GGJ86654.1 triosephosphate isomerase [Pseudomonas matsuisoli]
MKKKLVIANWKMNGGIAANAELLGELIPSLSRLNRLEIAICPSFPYLHQVSMVATGSNIALGAQNVSSHPEGAFTGEVSARMLKEFGCRYVLIGHSERRTLYAEDDQLVAQKFEAALKADLIPVLCVGETLEEHRTLKTQLVIARQLQAVIEQVGIQKIADGVIAYEPVWAIGTGLAASPTQAQQVHFKIRQLLAQHDLSIAKSICLLYGGSVRADNAAELFAQADIDGGLIGGASLDAESFTTICRSL